MHLVIIGGSDAGTEAALRARGTDRSLEITMLVADEFVNFSVCGLPFFLSGEVGDWRSLAHRNQAEIAALDIDVRLEHRAEAIVPERRIVQVRHGATTAELPYDRLVVATGARAIRPPIRGAELEGVFVLHTMRDGIRLREWLEHMHPATALVLGSGYIGVELADALTRRGIQVTLAGRSPSVLRTVDPPLGRLLRAELGRNGVEVLTDAAVGSIARVDRRLEVSIAGHRPAKVDLVVIGAGVRPDADLGAAAGAELGRDGAIHVTRAMQTSLPAVYAAGDCVETWHAILERPAYLPLGTTSHKQGRVAGENAAGGATSFGGSIGTQIVKVFDLAAARTGLSNAEASAAGFSPATVETAVPDHKPYYPGASALHIRLTGDVRSGRLLGAQIVGNWRAGVAKRIDVAATAIQHGLAVEDVPRLDLGYTPPVGSPWDALQVAADDWIARGRTPRGHSA